MGLIDKIDTSGRVLVVEDEAYIAAELEHQLIGFGFDAVEVCLSYDEAEMLVNSGGFDLVVFDILIGGKMSFSLISDAIEQGCAVVASSGYFSKHDGLEDLVFVAKPVREVGLADAIIKAQAKIAGTGGGPLRQLVGSL